MRQIIRHGRATPAPQIPARDPAPSRWSYRAQRLWLTPFFRSIFRAGIPAAAIVAMGAWYLSDPSNIQSLRDGIADFRRTVEDRPEFRVNLMSITGASPVLSEEIRATLALDFPASSFDLDLVDYRQRIERIRAVERADLRIRSGGELAVTITERRPALIWQAREGLWLIDASGERVAPLLARPNLMDLPQIAGENAHRAAPEALALFAAARPLGERMRGLVRMSERRWDLVLSDGIRVLLPAENPVAALEGMLARDDAQDLLERNILRVDLRRPDRLVLQLTPEGLAELRQIRQTNLSAGGNG